MSSATKKIIKQGESIALTYALDPEQDLTDWACRVQIRSADYTLQLNKDVIDTDGGNVNFLGLITDAECEALGHGDYYVAAELSNATTNESIETMQEITISRQYVYD